MEQRRDGRSGRDPRVSDAAVGAEGVFAAEAAYTRWLSDRILTRMPSSGRARVLDVGCGDGALIERLAAALPEATLVGIDLSAANIAAARTRIAPSPVHSRVTFERADYLAYRAGRFDLVVASSTLQGMQATTAQLAAKLDADTARGGRLIHVTPYRCAYNTSLNVVRRALRRVRGAATDRIILTAARALHPHYPIDRLRQRVDYMYLVIRHYEDTLRALLESRHHFSRVHLEPARHTSIGQPKHRLAVLAAPGA